MYVHVYLVLDVRTVRVYLVLDVRMCVSCTRCTYVRVYLVPDVRTCVSCVADVCGVPPSWTGRVPALSRPRDNLPRTTT